VITENDKPRELAAFLSVIIEKAAEITKFSTVVLKFLVNFLQVKNLQQVGLHSLVHILRSQFIVTFIVPNKHYITSHEIKELHQEWIL